MRIAVHVEECGFALIGIESVPSFMVSSVIPLELPTQAVRGAEYVVDSDSVVAFGRDRCSVPHRCRPRSHRLIHFLSSGNIS